MSDKILGIAKLNGIDLGHVQRSISLNATARYLVRAAYVEIAPFNNLAPGEFYLLSGFIARIHGLNASPVVASSQSIKNSLQQTKHDVNKRGSSTKSSISVSKIRTSTATEQLPAQHSDEDEDDEL